MQVGNFERLSAEEIRAVDLGNLKTDQVEKFAFSKQYTSWMAKVRFFCHSRVDICAPSAASSTFPDITDILSDGTLGLWASPSQYGDGKR